MTENLKQFLKANANHLIIRVWPGTESAVVELADRRTFILNNEERTAATNLNWHEKVPAGIKATIGA